MGALAKHTLPHLTEPQDRRWLWKVLVNKPEPLTMLFSRFSPSFSFTGSISQGLWLWHIWKEHLRPGVSKTDPRSSGGGGQPYQLRDGCQEPCSGHSCPQPAPCQLHGEEWPKTRQRARLESRRGWGDRTSWEMVLHYLPWNLAP